MAMMREPYTGTVFEVAPSKVTARLASGWALLDGDAPASVHEAAEAEQEPVHEAAEAERADVASGPTDKPTASSTIAEIRAWAKSRDVELPKNGNKAALLAAIG